VSLEDIICMFFAGINPSDRFRVHTTGFGPGFSFITGGMPRLW